MLRSLYAGVSGMRNFQTKMDVIANNIANVNTTAFKSGSVRFQDMLSQTTASATGPAESGLGGTNAKQVGLGVKIGSIDMIMTGGSLQPTNRNLDFGIEGEGFFAVSQGPVLEDGDDAIISYTRDGAFYTDYEGNLVTSSGYRVLGYTNGNDDFDIYDPKDTGLVVPEDDMEYEEKLGQLRSLTIPKVIDGEGGEEVELQDFTIDGTGKIIGVYSDGNAYIIGQVGLVTFQNPEGLTKEGGNNYAVSNNSGNPNAGMAGNGDKGVIRQGFLEMSNVDLANEFTEMIVTSRAFQANSRSITTSDEMLQELINLKR